MRVGRLHGLHTENLRLLWLASRHLIVVALFGLQLLIQALDAKQFSRPVFRVYV